MEGSKYCVWVMKTQDVIWTSIQRYLNVMDVKKTSKQRRVLIGVWVMKTQGKRKLYKTLCQH